MTDNTFTYQGVCEIDQEDMDKSPTRFGTACTDCDNCNYFRPDRDADSTGYTCKCGHMKSVHWGN